jgi:DNA-binding FadR family transcriptional regulator
VEKMSNAIKQILKPVIPKRASDAISDQIKEMIYSGKLKPGDRLPSERELAVTLETGRMTVREALRMLEASGFVYIRKGAEGGTFIKELDGSSMAESIADLIKVGNVSLQDLTEARVAIETTILDSIVPTISEEQLDLLWTNIEQCESIHQNNHEDGRRVAPQLVNFHLLLASFSKNALLRYFLQSMIEFSTNFIRQYAPEYSTSEDHVNHHKAIFDTIKSRDIQRSKEVIKRHLNSVAENIELAMQNPTKATVNRG